MKTVKEEHVDYSEYHDFEDAYRKLKHWLEMTYMTDRIHQALDYATLSSLLPILFQLFHRITLARVSLYHRLYLMRRFLFLL